MVLLIVLRGRNYTMKVMPTPVNDAAVALRINQTKTEQALRKVLKNHVCNLHAFILRGLVVHSPVQ